MTAGPAPHGADAAFLLLHGRGARAESMLSLYTDFQLPTVAALAPQAAGLTWYPQSFLAPIDTNQPFLDSALRRLESLVSGLLADGLESEQIALLGFSQGACLAAEFTARHARRYGAVMVLTGGLIGPPGTPREYPGALEGTPVFLGSSDPDPHVPFQRVLETEAVLARMGAVVELRRYEGMPHTINDDQRKVSLALLQQVVSRAQAKRA